MTKAKKKGPGRPPAGPTAMKQIALRVPEDIIEAADDVVAERLGESDRSDVLRQFLRLGAAVYKARA